MGILFVVQQRSKTLYSFGKLAISITSRIKLSVAKNLRLTIGINKFSRQSEILRLRSSEFSMSSDIDSGIYSKASCLKIPPKHSF